MNHCNKCGTTHEDDLRHISGLEMYDQAMGELGLDHSTKECGGYGDTHGSKCKAMLKLINSDN